MLHMSPGLMMEKIKQELPLWRCHTSCSTSLDLLRTRALQAVVAILGSLRPWHGDTPWDPLESSGAAQLGHFGHEEQPNSNGRGAQQTGMRNCIRNI